MDSRAIADIFAAFGSVRLKRMFGGHGVYADDLCFALEISGEIFLKADAETQDLFAAAGSQPFTYERAGKTASLGYWRLPDDAFDDDDELKRWSNLALAAARRAASRKAPRAAKAPRAVKPSVAKPKVAKPKVAKPSIAKRLGAAPKAGRARPKPP
ncbi:DNA transformation protein [Rhizobiales bacterium GAS191]|jgi:DNA transformation protein|nr:DNA transformation protein [Rhizobiales bacterium GAS113]SEE18187.1 DNA transformation protein [Rhizobiales bacterium GAS191]SEE37393.1 DNA transformation protein [Rhizobiales bacterium GAS188]